MWDVTDLKNPQQIAQQAIPLPAGGGSGNSVDILRRLYCLHDRTAAAYHPLVELCQEYRPDRDRRCRYTSAIVLGILPTHTQLCTQRLYPTLSLSDRQPHQFQTRVLLQQLRQQRQYAYQQ